MFHNRNTQAIPRRQRGDTVGRDFPRTLGALPTFKFTHKQLDPKQLSEAVGHQNVDDDETVRTDGTVFVMVELSTAALRVVGTNICMAYTLLF